MPPFLMTSSVIQAAFRGLVGAICLLALLQIVIGLPLDWEISLILLSVGTLSLAIGFYDEAQAENAPPSSDMILTNVAWNFDCDLCPDLAEFVVAVSDFQNGKSDWDPEEQLAVRGSVEIRIIQFHLETDPAPLILNPPDGEFRWTQASLLYALDQQIDKELLGDYTFFEGLVKCGDQQYVMSLGS